MCTPRLSFSQVLSLCLAIIRMFWLACLPRMNFYWDILLRVLVDLFLNFFSSFFLGVLPFSVIFSSFWRFVAFVCKRSLVTMLNLCRKDSQTALFAEFVPYFLPFSIWGGYKSSVASIKQTSVKLHFDMHYDKCYCSVQVRQFLIHFSSNVREVQKSEF